MRKIGKNTKKKLIAAGAILMSAVVALGMMSLSFSATGTNAYAEDEAEKAVEDEYPGVAGSSESDIDKEETVYEILDADGKADETIVSEWLKNADGKDELKDVSTLTNIENTSGDEKFSQDGNNLTWDADGNDIYYQGRYSGQLPLTLDITYYLDGEKVSADEIAGKEGDVEIHFDYNVNNADEEDGYTLTHPYAVISAVMLDSSSFTDITTNAGKTVETSGSTACIGFALPGMTENLGLSSGTIDIPENFVVKAHTDSFSIDGTYTIAVDGLLQDVDTGSLDSATAMIDELEEGLTSLSNASAQLKSGTGELADGSESLSSATKILATGSKKISEGVDTLDSSVKTQLADNLPIFSKGTKKLVAGLEQLQEGTESLYKGMTEDQGSGSSLTSGSSTLSAGLEQLSTKLGEIAAKYNTDSDEYKAYQNEYGAIAQGSVSLSAEEPDSSSVDSAKSDVDSAKAGVDSSALEAEIDQAISDANAADDTDTENTLKEIKSALETYETQVNTYANKVIEYENAVGNYESSVDSYTNAVDSFASNAKTATTEYVSLFKDYATLVGTINGAQTSQGTQAGVNDSVKQLASGAKQIAAGVQSAADGAGKLASGAKSAKDGADELDAGVTKLGAGVTKLVKGVDTLDSKTEELSSGAVKIAAGAEELLAGANELNEGMIKFDEEGIQEFISALEGKNLKQTAERMGAVIEAAKTKSFVGGKLDSDKGESKIIIKTGEVKAENK